MDCLRIFSVLLVCQMRGLCTSISSSDANDLLVSPLTQFLFCASTAVQLGEGESLQMFVHGSLPQFYCVPFVYPLA